MKTLLSLFLLLALGASGAVVGTRFSEYPNVAGLTNSELFLVAVTNVLPHTNKNITYGQLRSLLASNNFVGSFNGDGRNVSNVVSASISTNLAGNRVLLSNPSLQLVFVPNQSDFLGTFVLGDGGQYLVHTNSYEGQLNTFMGIGAGALATTANFDTLIGYLAGASLTTADQCTFLGTYAGLNTTTGIFNTFIGVGAGQANVSGNYNSYLGTDSGLVGNGSFNCYFGCSSGTFGDVGLQNSFFGYQSGNSNLGSANSFFGESSGRYNLIGSNNVFVGDSSGKFSTNANYSVFVGSGAGSYKHTGGNSIFIGANSGALNTNGYGNVFLGNHSGYYQSGSNLFFIDNTDRSQASSELTDSLLSGSFASSPENQSFRINAGLVKTGNASSTNGAMLGGWAYRYGTSSAIQVNSFSYEDAVLALCGGRLSYILMENANGTVGSRIAAFTHYADTLYIRAVDERAGGGGISREIMAMDTISGNVGVGYTSPSEKFTVSGNISASSSVIATNAFVMPPVSAGPVWCTNGLAAMWNSNNNGQATIYLRTSAVGATTYADKLVAP